MSARSQTIYAAATPPGRSGVAIVRVSGPQAFSCAERLTGRRPTPRRASLLPLRHDGERLDTALVLAFPGPSSFTGEDVVEFQTHGSPTVLAALSKALRDLGAVPADPGAFTRRAFENGRLDLTQVEGLADLLAAETDGQRRQALRVSEGGLAAQIAGWIDALLRMAARIEAQVDFSDEGDVVDRREAADPIQGEFTALIEEMRGALDGAPAAKRMRRGLRIVLAGPPNAGKSTLLNALAGRDAAIVTDRPGTTRDALDVALDLGGVAVTLTDTAGLRETDDPVEVIGVGRARARIEEADLVLWLDPEGARPLPSSVPTWRLRPKADDADTPATGADLALSAVTGRNMDELLGRLRRFAAAQTRTDSLLAQDRQREAVAAALVAAERAEARPEPELCAEDLRTALHALYRLTGRFDVEHVLDALFADFCIGK